jgi:hypothetical protein
MPQLSCHLRGSPHRRRRSAPTWLESDMNDYPLLNLFLTMLYFFLFIAWIWLLVVILSDIFRSKDLGGWGKALWTIFIIIIPWLGVLVYLIARGGSMHERAAADAAASEKAFRQYVQSAASGPSTADEVAKLAELHKSGALTDEEFAAQKARLLA